MALADWAWSIQHAMGIWLELADSLPAEGRPSAEVCTLQSIGRSHTSGIRCRWEVNPVIRKKIHRAIGKGYEAQRNSVNVRIVEAATAGPQLGQPKSRGGKKWMQEVYPRNSTHTPLSS